MLTQSEREWLEDRADRTDDKFCRWCPYNDVRGREEEEGVYCSCAAQWEAEYEECLTDLYYLNRICEAAEFEERVAVKLAINENCGVDEDCPPNMPFGWGKLKAARLAVEEEMDEAD